MPTSRLLLSPFINRAIYATQAKRILVTDLDSARILNENKVGPFFKNLIHNRILNDKRCPKKKKIKKLTTAMSL